MAERRMFAKSIVLSDAFLDMPLSARCLYFTLGMVADDDGFVNAPKSIMRQCGASNDDMLLLLSKKFVISFDSGVIVIRHWRVNNYLRGDRYTPTKCVEEKSHINAEKSGAYTDVGIPAGIPTGIPSIGKDSIGKVSIDKIDSTSTLVSTKSIPDTSKGSKKCAKSEDFAHEHRAYVLAAYLSKQIKKRLNLDKPESVLQKWADSFDKCNRIDGHPWEEISQVLQFSQRDSFWQANILSGKKFREKYEQLLAKSKSGGTPAQRPKSKTAAALEILQEIYEEVSADEAD